MIDMHKMHEALGYFGIHHDRDKVVSLIAAIGLYLKNDSYMIARDVEHIRALVGEDAA